MALVEYHCSQCGTSFEDVLRDGVSEVVVRCPRCGSKLVRLSGFGASWPGGGRDTRATAGSCSPRGG